MNCFIDGQDYDEELKIDIANAMSRGELGIIGIKGENYELVKEDLKELIENI